MARLLNLFTNLFPAWVLLGGVLALVHPPLVFVIKVATSPLNAFRDGSVLTVAPRTIDLIGQVRPSVPTWMRHLTPNSLV